MTTDVNILNVQSINLLISLKKSIQHKQAYSFKPNIDVKYK